MTQALQATAGQRVQHGAYDTAYLEAGAGPPVLLIHGSGPGVSAQANWQGTMAPGSAVLAGHRLLAPDVVGFGATTAAPGVPLDHDSRVDQMIGFIEAMDLDRVEIVGNSMGGGLALAIAHRRPDLVGRMVLMGTVGIGFPISPGLDEVWGYTPSLANMASMVRLFAYDPSFVTDQLIALRYEASAVPGVHARYAEAFASPRQRHLDAMALTEDQLRSITVPTLLIHGVDDQVIPLAATSLRLVDILPAADLVVFGRCGHWTQIERATDFQAHVARFFAD